MAPCAPIRDREAKPVRREAKPVSCVLFAWCAGGARYLDALAEAGVPPALAVTGPRASAAGEVAAACARTGVPLERREDPNDPDLSARIRALGADLILVAGCPRVLGPEVLAAPRLGALNLHPSRLPAYRCKEPLFWALFHGEPTVGITVHHLTAEVDAGPVLLAREVPVPDRATSATLAPLVDRAGAALVPEILALAAAGALPPGAPQRGPATRFPPLRPEHGLVDLTRSAAEVDRLVRAAAGEIHAYTFLHGLRVVVLEGRPVPGRGCRPGQVEAVSPEGIDLATAEGAFRAERFLFLGRAHDAPALAAAIGVAEGDAASHNPAFGLPA